MERREELTVVFGVCLDQVAHVDAEILDSTQLAHFLSGAHEFVHVAEVLCHGPQRLLVVDVCLVPGQQALRRRQVFGNWFLRKHMLSCCKRLADEYRLNKDGQAFAGEVNLVD